MRSIPVLAATTRKGTIDVYLNALGTMPPATWWWYARAWTVSCFAARLENAQIDLDRYRTLLTQDSIPMQQVDNAKLQLAVAP